ncbi:MAG: Holliday junction resolvase RuvX [Planctomycetales bacterium]|nr:Holliday junction resolvase RuvX [Planctomycetales bacterium]NIM09110.1 Holliday junction resolvase RuvX [Planctomycetales bacterium]NIN08581.1 Holliday junction resolvase RuvX [Planctomycetales bacterium]NIN77703.1 Holliday junction resolvase RuvX [Planctomycetales bacterium]NIO34879.1 Holliday junction resolvase RuvX [Planctomycetales bacterium]
MADEREPTTESPGRIAGIDYGTARIGVALTDRERRIVSPWDNYRRGDERADAEYFRGLVAGEGVVLFVVGLPVHLSGRESEKSGEAREFGKWLQEVTGVPVEWFDERFTSQEADEVLAAGRLSGRKRAERRDKLAAQIMLNAYLESDRSGRQPRGLDED